MKLRLHSHFEKNATKCLQNLCENLISLPLVYILYYRCGSLNSCTVPVNSSIFGDPCPGTFKYVEVHYSCLEQGAGLTTLQERPPWLLDLTATPEPAWQVKHLLELNSSLQTSTRTSVTSPGTPSTQAGSPVVPGVHAVQGEPGEQGEPGVNLTDSVPTNPYSGTHHILTLVF